GIYSVMKTWIVLIAIGLAIFAAASAPAAPATAPADPPAPAALAPTYLSIGKELRLSLAMIRRTLVDLSLDPACRRQANQILDSASGELERLMRDVQAGRMPAAKSIVAVPQNLRAARDRLLILIGPRQSELLQEKLRSLRGEARSQIGRLRQALAELNLPRDLRRACEPILREAESAVEKLPDMDVDGNRYAAARQAMNDLFVKAHDELAKVLTAAEQIQLGPHFSELAAQPPATQPSPGS
ncbi:MAG: hypothetical protein ABSH08_10240, partial [Tepidisphaeraceae bacterium]